MNGTEAFNSEEKMTSEQLFYDDDMDTIDETFMANSLPSTGIPYDFSDENDDFVLESVAMMSVSGKSGESRHVEEVLNSTFVHEGQSARIHRLSDPENKYGGRTGSIAMKILNDQLPDEEDVSRIENEVNVLKHLANCDSTRTALKQLVQDGLVAIYLEWVAGTTLKEWIRKFHSDAAAPEARDKPTTMSNSDLKSLMNVARNICGAVADIHNAGIVHNDLRPEHIIVEDENTPVKIISFGSASFLTESNKCSYSALRNDLVSLGYIIYGLLSGKFSPSGKLYSSSVVADDDNFEMANYPNGQGGDNTSGEVYFYSTLVNKVPLNLVKIVMKLIEAKMTHQRYQSARDVCQELDQMIVDSNNFVIDSRRGANLGQLQFPSGKLYGRSHHLKTILDACERMQGGEPSEMIIVSGYSGTGKSTLVQRAGQALEKRAKHFASGKFDQLQQVEPYSAIIKAFNGFFDGILRRGPESVKNMKTGILAAVGSDVGVLANIFPRLNKIIGARTAVSLQVGPSEVFNRLKYFSAAMIRAISSRSHPLVLFLDDLQWADSSSLDFIRAMLATLDRKSFLFVGSYRNNEVTSTHHLAEFLADLSAKKNFTTEICLDGINREEVNDLVSDTLLTTKSKTKNLADIIYRKTSGNIHFVIEFLQSLYCEGLLHFSLDSESWQWDNMAIETKTIPDDVLKLLETKILKLPNLTQQVLMLLSCVGCNCPDSTLWLYIDEKEQHRTMTNREISSRKEKIQSAIAVAIDEGLLKKEGKTFKFTHDKIQSAVYSLIPSNERGVMHLSIGCLLLKDIPTNEEDNILFTAVDQLERGRMGMNEEMKEQVAELNLRAGQKAMSLAAFPNAASYLKSGISFLCDDCWNKNYEVSLKLYSSYAEAEYCAGNFHAVGESTGIILANAKSHWDKRGAYLTLVKTLGSQNRPQEAIEIASDVLGDLGEQIPMSLPDQPTIRANLIRSIHRFATMEDSKLLSIKKMDDVSKMAAMKFLHILAHYCYIARQNYFMIVLSRMLDLTLSYGVSKESCAALATCSPLLCAHDGGLKGSHRIGQMALLLLEKLDAQEYASQVHLNVYLARGWTEQLKLTVMPQYHAYQKGLQTGDIENAMYNALIYLKKKLLCGNELPKLEREIHFFGEQMADYKQELTLQATLPLRQAVLNLMGHSDNPLELTGNAMIQGNFLSRCVEKNQGNFLVSVYTLCGWLAYIFGDYASAAMAISRRSEAETNVSRKKIDWFGMTNFYDSLTFLALARAESDPSLISKVSQELEKLKKLAEFTLCNGHHRILLIEAEVAFSLGVIDVAAEKYDLAIAAAQMSGCMHEEAISNERAGDFYLGQGNVKAAQCYGQAIELYRQWGAQSKADHLCKQVPL